MSGGYFFKLAKATAIAPPIIGLLSPVGADLALILLNAHLPQVKFTKHILKQYVFIKVFSLLTPLMINTIVYAGVKVK